MKKFIKNSELIIDLGMNNGDDTEYYLKVANKVVAVEANPVLCDKARQRFQAQIKSGQLVILNAAICEKGGSEKATFYINLANDHWSSLDLGWASREGSNVREIVVDCVSIEKLFQDFGVPKYLKIDVEGVDEMVLDQLAERDDLPYYLSMEDCRFGYRYMSKMAALGYTRFKILDQSQVSAIKLAMLDHAFTKTSSGPFGDDIPGEWLSYEGVERTYSQTVRDQQGHRLADASHWWDIHCCGPADAD